MAGSHATRSVPGGAQAAAVPDLGSLIGSARMPETTWPAAPISAARLQTLPAVAITVATSGSAQAVERARTALELDYPYRDTPSTVGEIGASLPGAETDLAYQQLADVVVLVSLPIAGRTLAASVAAGLADRKRPFSMLRLSGGSLGTLRRVVLLESAVPLLAVAAFSSGQKRMIPHEELSPSPPRAFSILHGQPACGRLTVQASQPPSSRADQPARRQRRQPDGSMPETMTQTATSQARTRSSHVASRCIRRCRDPVVRVIG